MVKISANGTQEKSSLPENIVKLIREDMEKQKILSMGQNDAKELLLKSENPEIQALCRVMGLNAKQPK